MLRLSFLKDFVITDHDISFVTWCVCVCVHVLYESLIKCKYPNF